jgi:membrane-bound ClpP family serine protease
MSPNICVVVIAYLATLILGALWIFRSEQTLIPRTKRRFIGIAIRTAVAFAVLYLVFSGWSAGRFALAISVFILFFLVVPTLLSRSAREFLLTAFSDEFFGSVIFWMIFLVQQWVLGWPNREEFIPTTTSPKPDPRAVTHGHLVGRWGVTVCPLRPSGAVSIDGEQYEACADHGFIDANTSVEVTELSSFGLRVKPVSPSTPDQQSQYELSRS